MISATANNKEVLFLKGREVEYADFIHFHARASVADNTEDDGAAESFVENVNPIKRVIKL